MTAVVKRQCASCSKSFKGMHTKCTKCRATPRICSGCGVTFLGYRTKCRPCTRVQRACIQCGRQFRGTNRLCTTCNSQDRTCAGCGRETRTTSTKCTACWKQEKPCASCSRIFWGATHRCPKCLRDALPDEMRKARDIALANRRRAIQRVAAVAGPVDRKIYEAIRAESECVYCGKAPNHVDHVRPLASGGWEHPDNLVPACRRCNLSKGPRLLIEWDPARVARGASVSPKVAAELQRLLEQVA